MNIAIKIITILAVSVAFAIVSVVLGCLLAGIDRKITARMQGRVGPPLLQPYYDVRKLFEKDNVGVNHTIGVYVTCALVMVFLAGGIFFSGGNILMSVLVLSFSELLFVLAAYASRSPYAELGAHREVLQIMAYEPMVLMFAIGFYMATGSFDVASVLHVHAPILLPAIGIFIGVLFILTIKLRKSPFDLSYSHHAHQELVKGVTTEMSGKVLGQVEIMHWSENVMFMAWIAIFFIWANPVCIPIVIAVLVLTYFLEILIDNNFARVKWQALLKWAWIIALVFGGLNIAVLAFL